MVKTKEQLEELVKESVLTWEGFDTSDESLKQIFDWENEIVATLDLVEPTPGYVLSVSLKPTDAEEARAQTFFTPAEALGLCVAFSASMMYVGFGVPNAPEEWVSQLRQEPHPISGAASLRFRGVMLVMKR